MVNLDFPTASIPLGYAEGEASISINALHLTAYSLRSCVATASGANSDQLFMTIAGDPTNSSTISGTFTFAGGIGLFSDASGWVDFVGVIAPEGIPITVAFEGTIQY